MLLLPPDSFTDPRTVSFWISFAVVTVMYVGFWVSLYWWVARFRSPLAIAGGYFLSHTAVAAIVLPVFLAVDGDRRFVLAIQLVWCGIELPNVPVFALMSDTRTEARMAFAYIFLGGSTYAIIGFVIGSIALLYRPKPK